MNAIHKLSAVLIILCIHGSGSATPAVTTSLNSLDFSPPEIMVGLESREIVVTVSNTGTSALRIGGIELAGNDLQDFKLAPLSCRSQSILAPGERCDLQVHFVPTAPGRRQAAVRIQSDDPARGTFEIPLTGSALAPAGRIVLSPPSLDFGVQSTQTPSPPRRVTVENDGVRPLHIKAVSAGGKFILAEDCTTRPPLAGRGTQDRHCSIDVQFAPTSGGLQAADLIISSDDPRGPVSVPLKGAGAEPALTVSPGAINFGSRELNTGPGSVRAIKLDNNGSAGLIVSDVVLSGHKSDFLVNSTACTDQVVAPNASCTLMVTFTPNGFGHRNALLTIASNAPGATAIPLNGFGEVIAPVAPAAPTATDHEFVQANTGMACAGDGKSVSFEIPVTRALAPSLIAPAIAAGTLSSTATLELMVFNAGPAGAHPVLVNDTSAGTATRQASGWHLESFTIPITKVRFPAVASAGAPTPEAVHVRVDADGHEAASCVVVGWARLSIRAMSPVILVHGNNSDGSFFTLQVPSFVSALDAIGLASDSSISFRPAAASIVRNARSLQDRIPLIARKHGVDTVHLVAHSKGGLEARAWLSANAAANAVNSPSHHGFRVISLTTLSTPHLGSALADLSMAIDAASVGLFGVQFASGFFRTSDAGTADLTTFSLAGFNPPLPSGVDYLMIGADADRDGNGLIGNAPVDEYAGARIGNGRLLGIFNSRPVVAGIVTLDGTQIADAVVTTLYEFLRTTRSVAVGTSAIPVPLPPPAFFTVVTVTHPVPIPGPPAPNDILVTMGSATGAPLPFKSSLTFARDHGSVADGGVAAAILPFLTAADRARGGLR
jgi:hypothetical protein